MKYILNSAVITTPGTYQYVRISQDEVVDWVKEGDWESTVGYAETAVALSMITDTVIPVDRRTIRMRVGDEALVFRLQLPRHARRIDALSKGQMSVPYILSNCEHGILRRVA